MLNSVNISKYLYFAASWYINIWYVIYHDISWRQMGHESKESWQKYIRQFPISSLICQALVQLKPFDIPLHSSPSSRFVPLTCWWASQIASRQPPFTLCHQTMSREGWGQGTGFSTMCLLYHCKGPGVSVGPWLAIYITVTLETLTL